MAPRIVYDLCSGSGNFSLPYREAGYDVRSVDLPTDVRLIPFIEERVHGILCAPPCTYFSGASAWVKRTDDEYKYALSLVDACLRAVVVYKPAWWALENPVGTLRRWLGPPRLYFHPCDYGDPWTKRTGLWGEFTVPPKTPVPPLGSITSRPGLKSCTAKKERAQTPLGFARAFMLANP